MAEGLFCVHIGEEGEPETWEPMESPVPAEVPDVPLEPGEPAKVPERVGSS